MNVMYVNEIMIMSYRYRQRNWSRSDLGIQVHWHRDEDGHRYGYRNILPLHTIVYICGHRYAESKYLCVSDS